jgi:beta-1,4-mannosyl-glycoprotein beta-1,4-N-acetylglucosaminyltransferase
VTVWMPVMLRDELDMLEAHLLEYEDRDVVHVVTEAPVTHRGIAKPLFYAQNVDRFAKWNDSIIPVIADGLHEPMPPWTREHRQRDSAWPAIDRMAADDDVVVIGDVDEFPSAEALAWDGEDGVISLWMRTMLFCCDREVPREHLPPTAVMATAGWLRRQHAGLAAIRDRRGDWPLIQSGGMHLSWIGGVEQQREKLASATCHMELLNSIEGRMIRDGTRYRTGEHGVGHLPVVDVEITSEWPRYVRERRCPPEWLRPALADSATRP